MDRTSRSPIHRAWKWWIAWPKGCAAAAPDRPNKKGPDCSGPCRFERTMPANPTVLGCLLHQHAFDTLDGSRLIRALDGGDFARHTSQSLFIELALRIGLLRLAAG